MASTCPVGFDVARLRATVGATYDRLARDPAGEFHFHRGPDYARNALRYPPEALAIVPPVAAEAFAGVGNPHRAGPIAVGETVLDHACGAGMDLVIAAHLVGSRGRVIGVDMTAAMLARARDAAVEAGVIGWVELREGLYEALPVADRSVDVVISNGVLNLAPDKPAVLREIARVLRPGGRLHLADVVVARELTLEARRSPELWAACIAGALPEPELFALTLAAGFSEARAVEHYDCFAGTSALDKTSADLRVRGVTVIAKKA